MFIIFYKHILIWDTLRSNVTASRSQSMFGSRVDCYVGIVPIGKSLCNWGEVERCVLIQNCLSQGPASRVDEFSRLLMDVILVV